VTLQIVELDAPLVLVDHAQLSMLGFSTMLVEDESELRYDEIIADIPCFTESQLLLWNASVWEAAWVLYD
jgi:hypothetical protein